MSRESSAKKLFLNATVDIIFCHNESNFKVSKIATSVSFSYLSKESEE